MNDVNEIIRKAVFGERWRSIAAIVLFLGLGGALVAVAASSSHWNGDVWTCLGAGTMCLGLGAYFVARQRRLPALAAHLAQLFSARAAEVAWLYDQELTVGSSRKVWNVYVWTSHGEKHRLALYTRDSRDRLWAALSAAAPHAVAPYSKERERAMRARGSAPGAAATGQATAG